MKTLLSPARLHRPSLFSARSAAALILATIAGLATVAHAQRAQPADRISGAISNASRTILEGSASPRAQRSTDLGAVDSKMQLTGMTLVFSRSAAQQQDLNQLLAAQQNPSSSLYHQWLTPTQFGARFGVSDNDLATTESWLQSQGFSVVSVSPSRDSITFSGTASAVESAFGAPLHYFRATSGAMTSGADNLTHVAPAQNLSLPAALSSVVLGIGHLSDYRPQSHAIKRPTAAFTSSISGSHYLSPKDVATIYDLNPAYSAGYYGSGQTIVVAGQSQVVATDIANFQTAAGVTTNTPNFIIVPSSGSPVISTGDEAESDLDLEYSSSIANKATIDFIYTGSNSNYSVFDSIVYAIQNKIGTIITVSYGECEPDLGQSNFTTLEAYLQQGAAQGQSIITSSGDSGSTACYGDTTSTTAASLANEQQLAVNYPASSLYVTGLGGTEFPAADVAVGNNTYFTAQGSTDVISSALSYIPEQAWNDDSTSGGLSSGGGGTSIYAARPTWQAGVTGIPAGSFRLVPDISLDSSPNNAGYLYCSSDTGSGGVGFAGSCTNGFRVATSYSNANGVTIAGGTSFAAPIFAGMLAILNQAKGYTAGQGLVNPTLYSLASNTATYASAFHDIISGTNACTVTSLCGSGSGTTNYATTTGYDEATGLGSIDLNKLINAWTPGTTSTAKSFTLTAPAISVTAGSSVTETITVTPVNGYTGTVNFTLPTNVGGATNICYSSPAAVTVSGTASVQTSFTLYTSSTNCTTGVTALHVASLKAPSTPLPSSPWKRVPVPAAFAGLILIALSRRRSRLLQLSATLGLSLFALGIASVGLTGCSNKTAGASTTATTTTTTTTTNASAGTYTFVITGTDSATSTLKATATVSLTVN
jgi:subtilase family serine protease